ADFYKVLPDIDSRTGFEFHIQHGFSFTKRSRRFLFLLPLGLWLLQSEVRLRQPDHFIARGWPTIIAAAFISSRSEFAVDRPFGQASSFSSSEVTRRAMGTYSEKYNCRD